MLAGLQPLTIRRVVRADAGEAAHPLPDSRSVDRGRAALHLAGTADDLLLILLSGGASSLLSVPADDVTLADKVETIRTLMARGAAIEPLNVVRKHLSRIKGGQLARAARCETVTLALSDVVGDDPGVIASGPTVPDRSTFGDALAVLERFGGANTYPAAATRRLRRGVAGEIPETPKPDAAGFMHSRTEVIGRLSDAMRAAAHAAQQQGYRVHLEAEPLVGEARDAARRLCDVLSQHRPPVCVMSGGETTVTVRGQGRGGRNQELALALVPLMQRMDGNLTVASVGTDGVDGPTDAAGAVVDETTLTRARAAGLDPARFLEDNNSYAFFDALGDLIRTGPTGTNVGDLQIAIWRT